MTSRSNNPSGSDSSVNRASPTTILMAPHDEVEAVDIAFSNGLPVCSTLDIGRIAECIVVRAARQHSPFEPTLAAAEALGALWSLSEKETRIVQFLAFGHERKDIQERLGFEASTLDSALESIFRKTQRSRASQIRTALQS